MRKLFYWAFAFSLCALMGCKDDGARVEVVRYAINEPVFMSISEFRNSVKVTDEVVPITKRGKICFYKDYLYISSIHLQCHIDNIVCFPHSHKNKYVPYCSNFPVLLISLT